MRRRSCILAKVKIHPAAELFPPMTDAEFQEFKKDIAANGLREPIVFWKGQLLDGRHRLQACEELGIEPQDCELDSDFDPWTYAISHNLHRRHLTTSQRTDVAEQIATKRQGDGGPGRAKGSKDTFAIDDAAKLMNVSPASIKRRREVRKNGSDKVNEAIRDGKLPVSTAAEFVKAVPDKAKQSEIVARGPESVREVLKRKKTDLFVDTLSDADKEEKRKKLPEHLQPMLTERKPAEPLTEEQRKQGLSQTVHTASGAMQYVEFAIRQLVRIEKDDPNRARAFQYLKDWIRENEQ
jgi:ParB-like chromosome segregation protein Spo0J